MKPIKDIIEWLGYIFALIGFLTTVYHSINVWLNFKRLTWSEVDKYSKNLIKKISKDKYYPDVIVTIGRGGAIIGSILSGNLPQYKKKENNITVLGVDRVYEWNKGKRIEIDNRLVDFSHLKSRNVLIVAGDIMTGATMEFFLDKIKKVNTSDVKTACLLKGVASTFNPDYFGKEISAGFRMPWMYKGFGYSRDSRVIEKK